MSARWLILVAAAPLVAALTAWAWLAYQAPAMGLFLSAGPFCL